MTKEERMRRMWEESAKLAEEIAEMERERKRKELGEGEEI